MTIPVTAILPNVNDCEQLRTCYIMTVARIIVDKLDYFKFLKECIPKPTHKYFNNMCQKSETVCCNILL